MTRVRYVVAALVAGVAVALLTGLYDCTPAGLVGAVWYGFPFTWLRRLIVAPQYFPWVVDWAGLAYDFVVWIVLFGAILFLLSKGRHS